MEVQNLTVFAGSRAVVCGPRETVIPKLRELHKSGESAVLVFDDTTGEQVDLDLRSAVPAEAAPERPRPGRPKLGVVPREVTLLPRHWEWLGAQPGGASVTLRKLVDAARRENAESDLVRRSQESAFRFMTALAGNEPGFEEACRALYAGDRAAFASKLTDWPTDVAEYAARLAEGAFGASA